MEALTLLEAEPAPQECRAEPSRAVRSAVVRCEPIAGPQSRAVNAPRLPNADEATVPREKLRDYALDPEHPLGRHKARVFRSALGITQTDWEYLRDQILAAIPSASVATVRVISWGTLYEVPILIEGLNGATHEVTTAWIVAPDDERPKLVSTYVNVP